MSTGAECNFTEVEPGQWTYWLQSWPYGDSPDGQTYGPFASYRAAQRHLSDNHANPGGSSVTAHPTSHRHEYEAGSHTERVTVGVDVTMRVESLGPEPDRKAVLDLLRSLPDDSPAWNIRPATEWGERVGEQCAACHKWKEPE